jgi:hypothetical protein
MNRAAYKTFSLAALLPLVLLAVPGPAPRPVFGAAAPVLEPWRPEAERLLGKLGDVDFRVREDAERRLMAMGVKVVPVLRKGLGHRDLDVRRRVLTMIPALESVALLAPKRVTLKIDKQPLRVVLDQLSKHTGYKLMNWGGGGGPAETLYSFDFKNATFWEAVDQVCHAAGLVVQQSWGDDQVRLQQQGGTSRFVGRAGAFRYQASNLQLHKTVDLSAPGKAGAPPARTENLTFSFVIFAEPKLPFMAVGDVQLDAAYDDLKGSMLVPRDGGPWEGRRWGRGYHSGRQLSMHVSLELYRASRKATKVKLLRGSVPVTLLISQRPIVVTDKVLSAKGKKFKVEGVEIHFQDVVKLANGQYQLKMSLTNNAAEGNWMNSLYQRLELQDNKGQKYQTWGTSWGGNGLNNAQLTFTYAPMGGMNMGAPAKFIYQSWTTRQHHILFEFRDLPLP